MSEKAKQLTQLKSLGGQAVTFPLPIPLQRLDGTTVEVIFTCQSQGKRAWSLAKQRHIDAIVADTDSIKAAADATGQPLRLHEAVARAITANASLAMEFVTGWSLTDDFNLANLEDLEDRFGDTLDRLIKAYDKAVYQGQLGN